MALGQEKVLLPATLEFDGPAVRVGEGQPVQVLKSPPPLRFPTLGWTFTQYSADQSTGPHALTEEPARREGTQVGALEGGLNGCRAEEVRRDNLLGGQVFGMVVTSCGP